MDFFIDWLLPVIVLGGPAFYLAFGGRELERHVGMAGVPFSRTQLLLPEYDPIASGDICLPDLRRRYEGKISLDHAAAIRGVLVREDGHQVWIWAAGRLHDEIAQAHGHERPLGRHRNQYRVLPRVEFEKGSDVQDGLRLLLKTTPIRATDLLNVNGIYGLLGCSIGDCLEAGT